MALTRIDLTHSESDLTTVGLFGSIDTYSPRSVFHKFGRWFKAIASGQKSGAISISRACVKASGTITFASFADSDTVTINGVTLTGKTSPSGASQFAVGSSNTECAANLAAKINASALAGIVNVVTATSSLAVVTITCSVPGSIGNLCSLAISAHGSVSAANLASGADGTVESVSLL